jgi:predicted nucleic acid-binding protein
MTTSDVPAHPSVLNTTVLSNFASIDQVDVVAALSGICMVPVVREELEAGVADHPYLSPAVDAVDECIPVAQISETVANREAIVRGISTPGRRRHSRLLMSTMAAS